MLKLWYCEPGHINHTLFWENLAPTKENGGRLNDGKLDELIQRDFGSLDALKKQVNAAAAGIQGSGWAWLGVDPNTKRLAVSTTANQDPLLDLVPLFGIDMWWVAVKDHSASFELNLSPSSREHAFYLQHQNRKPDYLENIWKVINFETANDRLTKVV